MQEKVDVLNNTVQENVTNVRVVKSFVREDYETVKFGKAFYASGKTSNIVINSTIPVFLYGSFSKVSESAVTPVENTHLAVIPNDVKEAMFFESEFEEYRNRVNVRVFNNITTVDMKSFSE